MKKCVIKRKILATVAMPLAVCYWLKVVAGFLVLEVLEGDPSGSFAAVWTQMMISELVLSAAAGLVAIFSGIWLFRRPSVTAVKLIVILMLIFVGLILGDYLDSCGGIFASALLMIAVYPVVKYWVLYELGIEGIGEMAAEAKRAFLALLAWALWISLLSLVELALPESGLKSFLLLFGPSVISYGAYRYTVKKLELTRPRKHLYAFERQGIEPIYPPGAKPE